MSRLLDEAGGLEFVELGFDAVEAAVGGEDVDAFGGEAGEDDVAVLGVVAGGVGGSSASPIQGSMPVWSAAAGPAEKARMARASAAGARGSLFGWRRHDDP